MLWDSICRKIPYLKSFQTKWHEVHISVLPRHKAYLNEENVSSILAVYKHLALSNKSSIVPTYPPYFWSQTHNVEATEGYFLTSLYMELVHSQWSGICFFIS